jgi:hypothetical protein
MALAHKTCVPILERNKRNGIEIILFHFLSVRYFLARVYQRFNSTLAFTQSAAWHSWTVSKWEIAKPAENSKRNRPIINK